MSSILTRCLACFMDANLRFSAQASGDDSSNLSLVMVRIKDNLFEDSVQGFIEHYKGDYERIRQDVYSAPLKGKWTLGGNHRYVKGEFYVKFLLN